MTSKTFDHLALVIADMERSMAFYTTLLETPPLERRQVSEPFTSRLLGYDEVVVDVAVWGIPGGSLLELVRFEAPFGGSAPVDMHRVGSAHFGLRCDDLQAEFERLQAAGVSFRSTGLVEVPPRYGGGWACFAQDPDGHTVELIQPPARDQVASPSDEPAGALHNAHR